MNTKEPWYRNLTWWFIGFAVISAAVTLGIMIFANHSLKESHDAIIQQHEKSMLLTKSLLNQCREIENDRDHDFLTNRLLAKRDEDAAANLANLENDQKTLHLLELEFTKIQNEYEVLNLWCALLTVVFLIFSFFSLIKTNELARQGEEALTNLKATAMEAETKSASIDEKVNEAETRIQSKETSLIDEFRKSLEKELVPVKKSKKEVSQSIEKAESEIAELDAKVKELNEDIDKRIIEIRKEIPAVISKATGIEAKKLINSELKRIIAIEGQLTTLTKRVNNIAIEKEREEDYNIEENVEGDDKEIEHKEEIEDEDQENENPQTT